MNESIHLQLTVAELNLMLEALGGQAYYKVYELIAKLQTQAQEQLQPPQNQPATNRELQPATPHHNGVPTGEP